MLKQIKQARNQTYYVIKPKQSDDLRDESIENIVDAHLAQERKFHVQQQYKAHARESCMDPKLFVEKSKEFRARHEVSVAAPMVYLSDEMEEMEEYENLGPSQNKTISDQQTKFIKEKILGFQRDYTIPDMDEDEKPDPSPPSEEQKAMKESQKKKQKRQADFKKLPPIDFN